MKRTFRRFREGTFLAICSLLLTISLSGQSTADSPESVWVAFGGDILKVDANGMSVSLRIPQLNNIRRIGIDDSRRILWAYGNKTLSKFNLNGSLLGTFPLPLPVDYLVDVARLEVNSADGSIWLSVGQFLWKFDDQGRMLANFELSRNVQALALDPTHTILWVATDKKIYRRSSTNGAQQMEISLEKDVIKDIDVELTTGQLWVVSDKNLRRCAMNGSVQFQKTFKDAILISSDNASGAWIATNKKLLRINSAGNILTQLEPFNSVEDLGAILALVADFDSSAWASNQNKILQVNTQGTIVRSLIFKDSMKILDRIRDLALSRATNPDPSDMDDDGDGTSENQGDCNDADRNIHPGATETCNQVDDNCNGTVDEGNVCNQPPVIISTPVLDAFVGEVYSYDVNASDEDGDTITYSLPTAGPGMTIDPETGVIQWTPTQTGVQNVEVKATDTGNLSDMQSFNINVTKINQAPTAFDDLYAVRRKRTLTVDMPGVLGNDLDPDGDSLTANLVANATKGTLNFSNDGSFDYTPSEPPPDSAEPVLKFTYKDADTSLVSTRNQPLVVDLDRDGISEIVFTSMGPFSQCRFIAVHGNGTLYFSINAHQPAADPPIRLCDPYADMTSGDIDNDGFPEIIAVDSHDGSSADILRRQLIAFNHDGTLKWKGVDVVSDPLVDSTGGFTRPIIANITGDNKPEIVVGYGGRGPQTVGLSEDFVTVFDHQGQILWTARGAGTTLGLQGNVVAADINLDGRPEILYSDDVYDQNGNRLWSAATCSSCFPRVVDLAVGNLDDDPFGEIVYVDFNGNVGVWEHTGAKKWGPINLAGSTVGAITIGDSDGDAIPEILITKGTNIYVISGTGTILRTIPVPYSVGFAGGTTTVFDLNGDGKPELIHNGATGPFDEISPKGALYIFDGRTGTLLHSIRAPRGSSGDWNKGPMVADVDGDGAAEIVTGGWNERELIHVFEAKNGNWARSRPIYNQPSYHITNVNSDGTIPASESINWLTPGLNNFRMNIPLPEERAGQDTDLFTYKVNDGNLDSNTATVAIDILPPNTAPSILSQPLKVASANLEYLYAVRAVDPDAGEILNYTLPIGPAGMTIDASTGLVRWTPAADQSGAFLVAVKVTDSQGEFVYQGFTIQVATPVVVPDVVGQQQSAAETTIANAGLILGAITNSPSNTVPAGDVISQEPAAGTTVPAGSAINLVISSGQQTTSVPNVVGQSQSSAYITLFNAGLTTGSISTETSNTVPAGKVISQDPPAGSSVPQGSAVNLVISTGTISLDDLASIIVNPGSPIILAGQTQTFTATGIFNDGTSMDLTAMVTWTSDSSSVATVSLTGVATGSASGTTNVNATINNITGSTLLTVVAKVPGDTTLPTADITSPANNSSVTGPVSIIGTATDANFLKYELEYAPAGEANFFMLATGTNPVTNGTLGALDPTLLPNDIYTIRLTVYDAGENIKSTSVQYQVDGNWKVGLFTLTFKDLSVPLSGLPIVINRVYDSREKHTGDFGVGWRLGVQTMHIRTNRVPGTGWVRQQSGAIINLLETDEHKVSIILPDGDVEEFDMQVSPTSGLGGLDFTAVTGFTPRPGTLGKLEALANNSLLILNAGAEDELVDDSTLNTYDPQLFRYTAASGMQFEIHRTLGVRKITDLSGNTLIFDSNGITHSSGKGITFLRDANGRITELTDPNGNTQRYSYDDNGNLMSHTDALGNTTSFFYNHMHGLIRYVDPLGRQVARNEYDEQGRLIAMTDTKGNRITIRHDLGVRQEILTDRLGRVTVHSYDEHGNIVSITNSLGETTTFTYDSNGNQLSETNPLGETTTFTYDSNNNLTSVSDPLGNTITMTYDTKGNVLTLTDPLGHTRTNAYDSNGNLITQTDPLGNTVSMTYDSAGNPRTISDPLGNISTNEFNAFGNRTKLTFNNGNVISFTHDANGNLLSQEDASSVRWKLKYDAANRPTELDASGIKRAVLYDAANQIASMTDSNGQEIQFTYDPIGQIAKIGRPDGSTSLPVLTYDAEGNILTETDPLGNVTLHTYDSANRRIATTFANASTIQRSYDAAGRLKQVTDALGRVARYDYDSAGRKTRIIDALNNVTNLEYDAIGNLVAETDPLDGKTRYLYDAANRLIKTTFPDGAAEERTYDAADRLTKLIDAAGNETTFQYNTLGQLTALKDALGNTTAYEYDMDGRRTAFIDANGNRSEFIYDALGRLVTKKYPLGDTEQATYDTGGRPVTSTNGNGQTIQFTYDALGRMSTLTPPAEAQEEYTYTVDGLLNTVTDSRGITRFEYEPKTRRLARVTEPDGRYVRYTYDLVGNRILMAHAMGMSSPEQVTLYAYDAVNRLTKITDPNGGITTYIYDSAGNKIGITRPNGTYTELNYDSRDRLISVVHRNAIGVILASFSYTLDSMGNRMREEHSDGSWIEYDYDAIYRLIAERHFDSSGTSTANITYNYDAAGNLISKTGALGNANYTYNADNQLTVGDGLTYAYDGAGNLLSTADPSGALTRYNWDARGRMMQLQNPAGDVTTYSYDWRGIRQGKSGPGGIVNYLIDRENATGFSQVVRESDAAGSDIRSYVYGSNRLGQFTSGLPSYFHTDGLGTTRLLTDAAGNSTDTYSYAAYGPVMTHSGTSTNPFLFAGEHQDPESGLYYLRARYYDPAVGRFLSRDAATGNDQNPLSLHKYLYTHANPVNFTDPSGLSLLADVMETMKAQMRILRQQLPRLRRAKEAAEETVGETSEMLAQLFIFISIVEADDNRAQLAAFFSKSPTIQTAAVGELIAIGGDMTVRNVHYDTKYGWCERIAATVIRWETPPPPSTKGRIALCPAFMFKPVLPFSVRLLFSDPYFSSKMGTIVHEFVHVTLRVDDQAYGCQAALDRAKYPFPLSDITLISPDNYRCFVEVSALTECFDFIKDVLRP